jgi:MFS transporter, putative metabolite:H+ symporter
MFAGDYRRRTIMLWIFQLLQTVGYYGFGSLAPVVLTAKGFDIVESLGYAALSFLGYPIGSALSIPLMERIERKWLISGSALVMAACGLAFGFAGDPALIVIAGFLLTCASNVFSNGFHIYQAEIFPTGIRSSAISFPYSMSRVAGALLPFIALNLLDDFGAGAVFTGSAIILVIVSLDVALLGPRSTGRSLEVVAQREGAVATGPA